MAKHAFVQANLDAGKVPTSAMLAAFLQALVAELVRVRVGVRASLRRAGRHTHGTRMPPLLMQPCMMLAAFLQALVAE